MGQRGGCSRNDFLSLIIKRIEGHYDSSFSSPAADPQRSKAIEGRRGAGVLGDNAVVVQCGKFGFEGILIQDD